MFINKKTFIVFNIVLILLEIVLVYFMIVSFLTKDMISPSEIKYNKYLKVKISKVIDS